MRKCLGAAGAFFVALVLASGVSADSTWHGLGTSTTSPLPSGSCLYFDQGPGTDTKACGAAGSYWAGLLGLAVAPTGSANTPLFNNGSGGFTNGTRSGNTTAVVTTTGAQTSGKCVTIDANGNHVADANACGGSGSGGIITFSTGSAATMSSTNVYMGPIGSTTSHLLSRPWVAPKTVTISGMICFMNGGPGAGNTWNLAPSISASGGAAADNTNQLVALSGTSSFSTTTNDTGITLNRGDTLSVHLNSSTGTVNSAGVTCSFAFQ